MRMYVGNLDFETTDEELHTAFTAYGAVSAANVIRDSVTGYAKGFGFVEMRDGGQAQAAVTGLNGSKLRGRPLTVNRVREGR